MAVETMKNHRIESAPPSMAICIAFAKQRQLTTFLFAAVWQGSVPSLRDVFVYYCDRLEGPKKSALDVARRLKGRRKVVVGRCAVSVALKALFY